jgi:TrmH family RNA methyltransferase
MDISRITSRENPLIKKMRLAAAQSRKCPPDLLLAEGIRVLEEALASGNEIEDVLISDGFGSSEREARLINSFGRRNLRVTQAPASLINAVSGVSAPQGAVALVRWRKLSLSDLNVVGGSLLICADGLQDPGNLGTLGRTARAAGAAGFITTRGTASMKNPKTIRASAGALFHIPCIENCDSPVISGFCRERNIPVYLASASGARSCWEVDFRRGGAVVLGNESRGASETEWPGAISVRIPMTADAESLNVAAAGSVILFEACRQRMQDSGGQKP